MWILRNSTCTKMPLLGVSVKMEVCLLEGVHIFPRDLPIVLILLLLLLPTPSPNIMASLPFHTEMRVGRQWEVGQVVSAPW